MATATFLQLFKPHMNYFSNTNYNLQNRSRIPSRQGSRFASKATTTIIQPGTESQNMCSTVVYSELEILSCTNSPNNRPFTNDVTRAASYQNNTGFQKISVDTTVSTPGISIQSSNTFSSVPKQSIQMNNSFFKQSGAYQSRSQHPSSSKRFSSQSSLTAKRVRFMPVTPTTGPVIPTRNLVNPTRNVVNLTRNVVNPTRNVVNPTRNVVNPTRNVVNPTRNVVNPTRSVVNPTRSVVTTTKDITPIKQSSKLKLSESYDELQNIKSVSEMGESSSEQAGPSSLFKFPTPPSTIKTYVPNHVSRRNSYRPTRTSVSTRNHAFSVVSTPIYTPVSVTMKPVQSNLNYSSNVDSAYVQMLQRRREQSNRSNVSTPASHQSKRPWPSTSSSSGRTYKVNSKFSTSAESLDSAQMKQHTVEKLHEQTEESKDQFLPLSSTEKKNEIPLPKTLDVCLIDSVKENDILTTIETSEDKSLDVSLINSVQGNDSINETSDNDLSKNSNLQNLSPKFSGINMIGFENQPKLTDNITGAFSVTSNSETNAPIIETSNDELSNSSKLQKESPKSPDMNIESEDQTMLIENSATDASKDTSNNETKCSFTNESFPANKNKTEDASNDYKMAIIKDYPYGDITDEEISAIQGALLKRLDISLLHDIRPRISNFIIQPDAIIYHCEDEQTCYWLVQTMDHDDEALNGTCLKVIKACDLLKPIKVAFTTKDIWTTDSDVLFKRLKAFNDKLNTVKWQVLERTNDVHLSRWILMVDIQSANVIIGANFSAYTGVDEGKFQFLEPGLKDKVSQA